MIAAIIVFPGSNRERDVSLALKSVGITPLLIWHNDTTLPAVDLIVLPGGFSYGDYLRCGSIAAHSRIMKEVIAAANRGVHIIGLCNGFQILLEAGLLPGALLHNRDMNFICRNVFLRVENVATPFTCNYQAKQIISLPIAHSDGNYFATDDDLQRLIQEDLIAFRYCGEFGNVNNDGFCNPNGSISNIAGIFNQKRNF